MELIASFWIVLIECVLCYAADHRGFFREAKSNYFKGYTKEASSVTELQTLSLT